MKILVAATALSFSSSIFGITIEEFGNELIKNVELQESQNLNDLTCGVGGCSFNIIENGMTKYNIKLSEEKNQLHNTTKINIETFDFSENNTSTGAVVCLSNETCKFFEPENLAYANYAYENDAFANNRSKRCGPCVLIPVAVPTSILVARAAVRAVSTTANIDFVYNLGKNVKKWFD
ncbi:hypothetical protein [Spirobacillus cienkowskii]|jgi:hypothetical protein|uniref:hypothetical protein n=1 Tax=Spirobacillus cienkowskii TaxID=495820 RepID=UPI0030CFA156